MSIKSWKAIMIEVVEKERERKAMLAKRGRNEFNTKRRGCIHRDRSYGSDWVTCLHRNNPTAIRVCNYDHCPTDDLVTNSMSNQA